MTKARAERSVGEDRMKADRLRKLRNSIRSLGKRDLVATFEVGEALEEAAALLRGSFSAWVASECGIEPRTALGYRKTFRVLGDRRDRFVELGVPPSVAMVIACAKPEGRERAFAALESGRKLRVSDAKAVVRVGEAKPKAPKRKLGTFEGSVRAFSESLLGEVERIVALSSGGLVDQIRLMELAMRARVLLPAVTALEIRPAGEAAPLVHPLTGAIADMANAATASEIEAVAGRLSALVGEGIDDADATDGSQDPVVSAAPDASGTAHIRSVSSAFDHGLTAIELCAGAGGQAVGLSKAGFRHLRLIERDPSACATLRAAFGPDHVVEADLVGYEPGDVGSVDLLAGGVPCQPFSQSGERKGANDERDLFMEAIRLVDRIQPRAVMLENVMGVFEPDHDMHRFRILAHFRRMGYAAEWGQTDATHFGVPQKRRRAVLVAFREKEAMARFRWPQALHHYAEEPYPVIAALDGQFRSKGWEPPQDIQDRMNRASPTVTGGSDKKQGIDFGQRKTALVWGQMGFVQTRIGNEAPGPDHVGDVEATNQMLAKIQGFPVDWPFRGSKKSVFRQIANAFPPPVALHLGCAIASALTDRTVDPDWQHAYDGMRWVHLSRRAEGAEIEARRQAMLERATTKQRVKLPLEKLLLTRSKRSLIVPAE